MARSNILRSKRAPIWLAAFRFHLFVRQGGLKIGEEERKRFGAQCVKIQVYIDASLA